MLNLLMDNPQLRAFVEQEEFDEIHALVNDKPRCLKQVQGDLLQGMYKSPEEFEDAVRLVFINAVNRWFLPHPENPTPSEKQQAVLVDARAGLDYFNHLVHEHFPPRIAMNLETLLVCRSALDVVFARSPSSFVALYARSPFKYPGTELPGYDEKIAEPMWFAEIMRKLELLKYYTASGLAKDVHLLFQNIVDFLTIVWYEDATGMRTPEEYHAWLLQQTDECVQVFDNAIRPYAPDLQPLLYDDKTSVERREEASASKTKRSRALSASVVSFFWCKLFLTAGYFRLCVANDARRVFFFFA